MAGPAAYPRVMVVHQLSRDDARRIAVRAQLLDRSRPADLLDLVRRLTLVQIDPVAAVAPSADLVAWSRLGSSYSPADLDAALADRALLELLAMIRPAEDLALYRADMARWDGTGRAELTGWRASYRDWVRANDACRRDILDRLRSAGPLPSRQLPDTCQVPWKSTGWTNNRNVTRLLDFMVLRGEVAVAGRNGADRLWDLAERVYPDDPVVPADEALRIRNERRLRALGIARPRGPEYQVESADVGQAGEPAVVEGVKGTWRVDPAQLARPFAGRAALLSPFDRLVHDRKRTLDLFGFDYQLEMYKPAAGRRWGYYALPVLYGDALVGKLDAIADRQAGVLRVRAVHQDVPFTPAMTEALGREIEDLARWLALDLILPGLGPAQAEAVEPRSVRDHRNFYRTSRGARCVPSLDQELLRVVDDHRSGDLVPQLLLVLVPQQPAVRDYPADEEKPEGQRHDTLADEVTQEHPPPARVDSRVEPHDPHAEYLLGGGLPLRPDDERPDEPPDPQRADDQEPLEQIATEPAARRRQHDASRQAPYLTAERTGLRSGPGMATVQARVRRLRVTEPGRCRHAADRHGRQGRGLARRTILRRERPWSVLTLSVLSLSLTLSVLTLGVLALAVLSLSLILGVLSLGVLSLAVLSLSLILGVLSMAVLSLAVLRLRVLILGVLRLGGLRLGVLIRWRRGRGVGPVTVFRCRPGLRASSRLHRADLPGRLFGRRPASCRLLLIIRPGRRGIGVDRGDGSGFLARPGLRGRRAGAAGTAEFI